MRKIAKLVSVSFGVQESYDVKAALAFLRKRYPSVRIGAIGVSLGGASCLLGDTPAAFDALVLEAVYPNIHDAVKNRLQIKFGVIARILSPLLVWQLKPRLGIAAEQLRPENSIKRYRGPLLLIAGGNDQHTPLSESRRLFTNANQPKQLWVIKNAAHVDFFNYSGEKYKSRIASFFARHLHDNRATTIP